VHHVAIFQYNEQSHAHGPYEFFRTILGGSYGDVLNRTIERTLLFLQEASGVPVLLSMLVLVFEERQLASERGELGSLPASRIELYEHAIKAVLLRLYKEDSRVRACALSMLSRVAVGTMMVKQREFDSNEVLGMLNGHDDELQLWLELQRREALPLIKVLSESSGDMAAAEFQFKHLSFAEALYARHIIESVATWGEWRDDGRASAVMEESFYENTLRIGGEELGAELAKLRSEWEEQRDTLKTSAALSTLLPGAAGHLTKLTFGSSNPLTGVDAAAAIGSSTTLNELAGAFDESATAALFTALLQGNSALSTLRLSDAAFGGCVEAASDWLRGTATLKCLTLPPDLPHQLFEPLAANSSLTQLTVSNAGLNIGLLATVLEGNGTIIELRAGMNDGDAEGCMALAPALRANSTLRMLDLSSCGIDGVAAVHLSQGFKGSSAVDVLKLSANPLGDAGGSAIVRAVRGRTQPIRELRLSFTGLGSRASDALCDTLSGTGWATVLDLNGNSDGISPQHARRLIELLHNTPCDVVSLLGGTASVALLYEFTFDATVMMLTAEIANGSVRRVIMSAVNMTTFVRGEDEVSLSLKNLSEAISQSEDLEAIALSTEMADALTEFSPEKKSILDSPCAKRNGLLRMGHRQLEGSPTGASNFCTSQDGRKFFSSIDGGCNIGVWDFATGHLLMSLEGHKSSVEAIFLSNDGSRLFSCGHDETVRLWDTDQGVCEMVLVDTTVVKALCDSPDGERIFMSGKVCVIHIWNARQGGRMMTLEGHSQEVGMLECSRDGLQLFSCSFDGSVRIWDLATGSCAHVLREHSSGVQFVRLSVDGLRLISVEVEGRAFISWDTVTWASTLYQLPTTLKTWSVTGVAESRDGGSLFLSLISGDAFEHEADIFNSKILMYDTASRTVTFEVDFPGALLFDMAISPDFRFLIVKDGDVRSAMQDMLEDAVARGEPTDGLFDDEAGMQKIWANVSYSISTFELPPSMGISMANTPSGQQRTPPVGESPSPDDMERSIHKQSILTGSSKLLSDML